MKRHPSLVPLSHDHHHGLALAVRCRKQALGQLDPRTKGNKEQQIQEVSRFFTDNLLRHFEAEEKILFPCMLSRCPETTTLVEELRAEHEEIRSAVKLLGQGTHQSKALFDVGDLLERHIHREERELFPIFESSLPPAEAEQVGIEIKRILSVDPPPA